MTDRPPTAATPHNRFLDRLPEAERRRLLPLLKPVTLAFEQVLYEPDGPITYAYFPTGSTLSALVVMRDGDIIEVATVGHEGLVGHYGFNGRTSPHRVVVQVGGGCLRIESRALEEQAEGKGPLRDLLSAYHIAFMAQVSQSVACSRRAWRATACTGWSSGAAAGC